MSKRPRIGFSSCYFHADPQRSIFKGKTLLYMEESIAHWIQSENVMTYMIPSVPKKGRIKLKDFAKDLDGLILQGGSDVAPETYGEVALKPEWRGDAVRDQYELELLGEFLKLKKPIFGVCRGAQLLNVAMGGTLTQDIVTHLQDTIVHRNWEIYDKHFHEVHFEEGSLLKKIYPKHKKAKVNSIHHQTLKKLGKKLKVEARAEKDGLIEAIRYEGPSFAFAVQWHPEFHNPQDKTLLDSTPLLKHFLSHL